jgi:predicted DNA-binding transcriptional regulator AlpA
MDRHDLNALPPLVDVPTAAAVLGIGRTLAYNMVKTGQWPTDVLRMGKLIRIPSAALLRLADGADASGASSTAQGRPAGQTAAWPVSR